MGERGYSTSNCRLRCSQHPGQKSVEAKRQAESGTVQPRLLLRQSELATHDLFNTGKRLLCQVYHGVSERNHKHHGQI